MKVPVLVASAAVLAAVSFSGADAMAQPPTTDRPDVVTTHPNRPLLFTGLGVIAASYIPPVIVAATSDRDGDKWLYVPIAGPWIDLVDRGGCGPNPCGEEAVYKTLLVGAGVAHLVGTGLILSSLLVPETRERTTVARSTKPIVVPASMGIGGAGLSMVGRF